MKSAETPIPLRLQTPTGDIKLTEDDLSSRLNAINYVTGKTVPVESIIALPPAEIYNVTFSDGRRGLYRGDGEIYLGGKIVSISEVIRLIASLSPVANADFYRHLADGEKVVILTENPGLKLDLNSIVSYDGSRYADQPDPYSAGCLLPVGDFCYDYVNLPSDRTDAVDSLTVNNNWEINAGENIDTIGFKRRGDRSEKLISWRDFIIGSSKDDLISPTNSDLIRSNYLITPVSDRLEFLRGFFDTNYTDLELEGSVKPIELDFEVSLPFYERLKFIRDIMFSLGIGSKMTSLRAGRNKAQYGLQPKCSLREFSQLFNKVEKAERVLAASETERPARSEDIYLRSIELILPASESYNIITEDKTKVIYLGTNFLPRISCASVRT